MIQLQPTASKPKIERTHSIIAKCLGATPYEVTSKEGNTLKGLELRLEGYSYTHRILTKQPAIDFLQSTVQLTGIMRDYQGKSYFTPKDATITVPSKLGMAMSAMASAGVSYAGDLF